MDRTQSCIQTLRALSVPVVIDARCRDIQSCVCPGAGATVITSAAAARAYDPEHPERIACIVVKRGSFCVVVQDREFDVPEFVRFWWLSAPPVPTNKTECIVCFRRSRKFALCAHCHAMTCAACTRKLSPDPDAMRCPSCRRWRLDGVDFGTPWEAGRRLAAPACKDPVDALCDGVLAHLDGCVGIVPRLDNEFYPDELDPLVKLARTNRYAAGSARLAQVRRRLKAFLKGAKGSVMVYVLRKTYAIDREAEKPVTEASVFRLAPKEGGLQQLSNDAWINVFGESETSVVHKVEYTEPHRFVLPQCFEALFEAIAEGAPGIVKTVSVAVDGDSSKGFNFDVAPDGRPATMHPDMIALCVTEVLAASPRGVHVFNRRLDDETGDVDVEVFVANATSCERLGPRGACDAVRRDMDGLASTRPVRAYV